MRYYTYRDQVPLEPGERLGFARGHGYYAIPTPTPKAAPPKPPAQVHPVQPQKAATATGIPDRSKPATLPRQSAVQPQHAQTAVHSAQPPPLRPRPNLHSVQPQHAYNLDRAQQVARAHPTAVLTKLQSYHGGVVATPDPAMGGARQRAKKKPDVLVASLDGVVNLVNAVDAQRDRASALGRMLRTSPSVEARSAAARALPSAGRLSKALAGSDVFEGIARSAPFVGAGAQFAVGIASGERAAPAAAEAIGGTVGGEIGAGFGTVVCGAETFATAGGGAVACGVVVVLGAELGSFAGSKAAELGEHVAEWIGGHLP